MRLKDWLKLAQKMTLEDWAALNYKD
jgi:hypothetical protein